MIPLIVGFAVNGWNVYRSLKEAGLTPVVIDDDRSSIFWASKGVRLYYGPQLSGAPLIETIRRVAEPDQQYVVISATEDAVRTLSERRGALPPNVRLLFPDHATVDMLLDKRKFYATATAGEFSISKMHFLRTWTEIQSESEMRFPCILKGRIKLYAPGLAKAYHIGNRAALWNTVNDISRIQGLDPCDFVIQEWVPGSDRDVLFCMQYYDADSNPVISFVGRKIRQWRPETGGTASAEPVRQAEALHEATRFFRSVRMRGICSMEFKWSSADRKLYMIEPTACRADYQEGVATANGYNIPLAAYADAASRPYACVKPRKRPVKWLHMGDDYLSAAHYIKHGALTWREYVRSLAGPKSYAIYASEDCGPFLELMRRKIAGKFKRLCSWN